MTLAEAVVWSIGILCGTFALLVVSAILGKTLGEMRKLNKGVMHGCNGCEYASRLTRLEAEHVASLKRIIRIEQEKEIMAHRIRSLVDASQKINGHTCLQPEDD